ncbi:MAG: DUF924 family protein [Desulfuromonadales bacterium]
MFNEILSFWFAETEPKMWWTANPGFDDLIRARFLPVLTRARHGELFAWRQESKGRLAEIIVLDQFSRNIYRNTPAAFGQDPMALVLAQEAVAAGCQNTLSEVERGFLLMPFMHSESRQIHAVAESLFRNLASPHSYQYELKHKAIIDRFGRYPHRNEILGRVSSPEEQEFLKQPGSRF